MRNLLFLFFCLILLFSCNRNKGEGLTTVEGVLVDEFDGTPLKNCEIILIGTVSFLGRLDNGKKHAHLRVKTDENGKFSFDFEAEIVYLYHVIYHSESAKYIGGSHTINSSNKNKITLKAIRAGFLKLNVINDDPVDTAKTLLLYARTPSQEMAVFYFEKRNYLLKDTAIYIQSYKDVDNSISWKIETTAHTIEGEEKYRMAAWDTTEFTIRY